MTICNRKMCFVWFLLCNHKRITCGVGCNYKHMSNAPLLSASNTHTNPTSDFVVLTADASLTMGEISYWKNEEYEYGDRSYAAFFVDFCETFYLHFCKGN